MFAPRMMIVGFLGLALLTTSGCEWFQNTDAEQVDDFPELGADLGETGEAELSVQDNLGEQVQAGDFFPLTKTIQQSLTQYLPSGPQISTSQIVLSLVVTVQEVRDDGSKLMELRYHDVAYQHEIGGERVSYRYGTPGMRVPPAAQAYDGLVENGFRFWLGPDNRVLELEGFDAFLGRCVEGVPVAEQQPALKRLVELHGRDGLTNFIDASVGLLPTEQDLGAPTTTMQAGATWTRQWEVQQPLPMRLNTQCTLKDLDVEHATVVLDGVILAAGDRGGFRSGSIDVAARGGTTTGTCVIDRATGLPVQSHVDCLLVMGVRLPDGSQFEQHKRTTTIIESNQSGTSAAPQSVQADHNSSGYGSGHAAHQHEGHLGVPGHSGHDHGGHDHGVVQTGGTLNHRPRD